jgi:pimeloyl-ACP methyl ester carboxylesterase
MDVAHTFKSLIPDSELETIDECGHAPMIEFPEWFAHRVEFFLQRRSFL